MPKILSRFDSLKFQINSVTRFKLNPKDRNSEFRSNPSIHLTMIYKISIISAHYDLPSRG